MTYQEYDAEMEKLTKAKKGFDGNRTLCAAVMVIVGYMAIKDDGLHTTPWYILLILGLVFAAALFILIRDFALIRKVNDQLKALESIDPDSLEGTPKTDDKE